MDLSENTSKQRESCDELFLYPVIKGYTIYTKEKCIFCEKVKKLLETEDFTLISCDDYLVEDRNAFLKFIEKEAKVSYKTFPMVFLNGTFVGGFTETKKQYEQSKKFNLDCEF